MKNLINWLLEPPTDGPRAILLIRLMAGSVFFWEGILKFVYTNQGVGRFTKLGFPAPHFTATADGWFEIVAVHHRNAGRNGVDEDSVVLRHVTITLATGAAADRFLGSGTRDSI
jgi:hypothetical protein